MLTAHPLGVPRQPLMEAQKCVRWTVKHWMGNFPKNGPWVSKDRGGKSTSLEASQHHYIKYIYIYTESIYIIIWSHKWAKHQCYQRHITTRRTGAADWSLFPFRKPAMWSTHVDRPRTTEWLLYHWHPNTVTTMRLAKKNSIGHILHWLLMLLWFQPFYCTLT